MSLDSLLHFISSSGSVHQEDADLAFAEVDINGRITSINPFGRLVWGWRAGTQLEGELLLALDGLSADSPQALPIMMGGLHLRGMSFGDREGWFLIGHEPESSSETGQQLSFRSLMDRIPMPACSLNTNGMARYTNAAAGHVLGRDVAGLVGQPVLAELIHPEDRWKLAEVVELAAGEGSSHTTVRFGNAGEMGVLHVVQSVPNEYHAIILPISGELGLSKSRIVPETFYQSFLEQGPVGILYLDAQGRVTFENHHFRSIVGSSSDDSWLGFPLGAVRILDQEAASQIMSALESGNHWTGSATLREPENASVQNHLHIHAAPILHPDGHRIGAALMVEDRTDLVQGKRALASYERLESAKAALRALSSSYPDPAGFRQKATELLAEVFDADQAYLLGLSMVKERLVEIARMEGPQVDPVSIAREPLAAFEADRFGRFIWSSDSSGLPVPGRGELWLDAVHDNEQFAGYVALAWESGSRDTEWASEARMNELLRLFESLYSSIQMAARYRTTVAAIDDALFGFSFLPGTGRQYHFITDQVEMLTGYHASEISGVASSSVDWMADIVHPEDTPRVRAHHRMLQDGHESRLSYRIVHRDGAVRWLHEHATPRTDATGMTAVNGILSDVSEQKAAEIVLLQAKKEAESSDESKTAFIATMSHEIRTPLGAVNGFAQLLEKELDEFEEELPCDLPDQVREFVSAISERAQKLQALVEDLFELSNVEMGKASLQIRSLDIVPVTRAVVEQHVAVAQKKGLDLEVYLPEAHCMALVDERRYRQVVDNLLSNAIKFTDRGRVSLRLVASADEVVLKVDDTGVGIAEDYQERMFDPFSQEEDWKNRRFEGTGLGLALVNRLVGLMGGSVEVDSRKGFGSSFMIALPKGADLFSRLPRGHAGGDGMAGSGLPSSSLF